MYICKGFFLILMLFFKPERLYIDRLAGFPDLEIIGKAARVILAKLSGAEFEHGVSSSQKSNQRERIEKMSFFLSLYDRSLSLRE